MTSHTETTAAPVAARRTNSLVVACYRWTRTCVHVLAGVSTTLLVFPLVSDVTRRSLVKRWSVRLLRILAVEVRLEGDIGAHRGNVMVVANHISWLDIFVLNASHPVRFVAKSEIAKWPVLSQMVRGAGTLFIERERPRDDSSLVIAVDHNACILCDRCIRGCDEIQNNDVIGRTGKGYAARIAFDGRIVECGAHGGRCHLSASGWKGRFPPGEMRLAGGGGREVAG